METILRPAADWELASFLAEATAARTPVEIVGGHSKARMGRSREPGAIISTHVMRGIRAYDPSERMITVQAGCLITDIERELAVRGQMLGFEPLDIANVFGGEPGRATIGGVISANLAGSRRLVAGGVADHLLGVSGVAGTGEIFRSGARTRRSVAGLDLRRAMAGSWGTLAALVEVTLSVEAIPDETATLVIFGLSEEIAIEAMADAARTPHGVTGTVHLEPAMAARLWFDRLREENQAITVLRVEAPANGTALRVERLKDALRAYGDMQLLDHEASLSLWHELRQLTILAHNDKPLWRITTRPSKAFQVVSGIRRYMAVDAFYDWSGGLIWLEVPEAADAGATEIRRVIASSGGHATLVRASDEVKATVDVFEPMHSGIELMTRRLKDVFDPAGILNPGRIYAGM
ncbi:MAG: FAD-binding protein [Alphaproteobacteria bacterium]|nr:FAD-binding protein [Alphaproteobacteria bacterium]